MICIYILLCVGILLKISPLSKAIESGCENCGCCKNGKCETGYPQGNPVIEYCILGCKPGFGGNRCYNKCPDDCLKCEQSRPKNCVTCADGKYFVYKSDDDKRCEDCPTNCRQCTSKSTCQECYQPYYNDGSFSDCSLSTCPGHCICESIGVCSSCKQGYFNVSNACQGVCPNTCENCTNKSHCQSCQTSYSGDICCIQNGFCKKCASNTVCERCVYGYYGEACNKPCPGTCQQTSVKMLCEREDGVCLSCDLGLYGAFCTLKCKCSDWCSNNRCHKDTGHCIDGCVDEYQGQNCTEESQDQTSVTNETKTDEGIGIASAVFVVVVILIIAINIAVVRRWKRNLLQKYQESINSVGYVNQESINSVGYVNQESINSVSHVNTHPTATSAEQFQYEQLDEVTNRQCEVYEVINSDIK